MRTPRSIFKSLPLLLGAFIPSCNHPIADSHVEFAHLTKNSLHGSPLAVLKYYESDRTQLASLPICVSGSGPKISKNQLLLETKIAYASWLIASGTPLEKWTKFEFRSREICEPSDTSNILFVTLPDQSPTDSTRYGLTGLFEKQEISCQWNGNTARCGTNSQTLGIGGPAAVRIWTSGASPVPKRIEIAESGRALFNPYVQWHSLVDDLKTNKQIADDQKKSVTDKYEALLSKQSNSLSSLSDEQKVEEAKDLQTLISEISTLKLTANPDSTFQQKFQRFLDQSDRNQTLKEDFEPAISLLSTLIHEVGHQFGMQHADNPNRDSITGTAEGQLAATGEILKTDLSVMAYGIPYFYLTLDDLAGIKNLKANLPD